MPMFNRGMMSQSKEKPTTDDVGEITVSIGKVTDAAKVSAMKDLAAALAKGDWKRASQALEAHYEASEGGPGEEDGEGDTEGADSDS